MSWTLDDAGDLRDRTILVTGSNTGIGFATARLLAGKGARIIMACRNAEKGRRALAQLKSLVPGAEASLLSLDLASLASVREAAAAVHARQHPLDGLINNAGLMMPPFSRTTDGFELQFGTNVLGHFALTGLLLPLLEQTPRSRVVWVSSIAHWSGRIDFDNLGAEKGYRSWGAYAQSKLADLMLAYQMQRRLRRSGASTIALAAHPGGTRSELSRNNALLKLVARLTSGLTQSTEDGAMPSIRAAIDSDARGGDYYGPSGFATFAGPAARQRSSRYSHDEAVAARLWQACEQLSGVRYLS